jgi:hypothetical protein
MALIIIFYIIKKNSFYLKKLRCVEHIYPIYIYDKKKCSFCENII